MKHFPALLKGSLALCCLAAAAYAPAELTRVPDPGKRVSTVNPEDAQARFALNSFLVKARGDANRLSPEPSAKQAFGSIRQRPGNQLRTAGQPKGTLNAVICASEASGEDYTATCYSLLDYDTGDYTPIYSGAVYNNGQDTEVQSGIVRKGVLYIPEVYYSEMGMITMETSLRWKRVDLATGDVLDPLYFASDASSEGMFLYGMAYDEVNDIIYGLGINYATAGDGGVLYRIDCKGAEWKAERLGDVGSTEGDYMCGIVFNPLEGNLYGLKDNGTFNRIDLSDPSNPRCIVVMEYDNFDNDYCFPTYLHACNITYSPYDRAYFFLYEKDPNFILVGIDSDTFEAVDVCQFIKKIRIGAMHCPDAFAEDDAPDIMPDATFNFQEAMLSGKYTIVLPETLFNGVALTQNVDLTVLLDGVEIYTGSHQPGEELTMDLTTTQGLHTLTTYTKIGNLKSPERNTSFYVGYDNPLPPVALNLLNGKLTWKAPAGEGQHNGFVELSDITYDVYVGDVKANDAPISGNEYTIDYNQFDMGRTDITVVATSHGVSSAKSAPINRTFGKGATLPVAWIPNQAQSELFETLNANHDNYAFEYNAAQYAQPLWRLMLSDYTAKPNDWLFLPPVYCESADEIYELTFNYSSAYTTNERARDNMDIVICSDPTPEGAIATIYSHTDRKQMTAADMEIRFTVPQPGTYYLAIHSTGGEENIYRGILAWNFGVQKSTSTTGAPADPTDVKITAAPEGELYAIVEATLPTKSLNGNEIDANTEVTLTARINTQSASATGKPGEKVTIEVPVNEDGIVTLYLTPSSEAGEGMLRYYTTYVGIDFPLPPTNVKGVISDDNMGVTLTWDAVPSVGQYGGYVDLDYVTYDIYSQTTQDATKLGEAGKSLTYEYRTSARVQNTYNIGPVAINEMGTSINGTFFRDKLGTPHLTPLKEEFGYAAFDYQKWTFNTDAEFSGVTWGHNTEGTGFPGAEFLEGGGIQAEGTGKGELSAPKVTTKDVKKAQVRLRYWDYPDAADMEIWGRTAANQEFRKIAALTPLHLDGEWQVWTVDLPEDFGYQGWIQANVRCNLQGNQSILIDCYEVIQDIDNDFMITSLTAPYNSFVGETATCTAVVTNSGTEPSTGTLKMELQLDGETVETQSVEIGRILAGDVFEYIANFTITEDYYNAGLVEVRAYTEADGDENPANNEQYVEFIITDHPLPIVRDLKGARADNGQDVNLTWSTPDTKTKDLESFETMQSFANEPQIGRWQNVDLDHMPPFAIEQYRWNNDDANNIAWQVFDAKKANTMHDERLFPRSGERMLLARSIQYNETGGEAPTRSFDWLISPEVEPGSDVSFWFNTLNPTYAETIQIWYSTTDTNLSDDNILTDQATAPTECGSFKKLQNFTKSGSETWEQCHFTLPANAKYFAFVYASFGMFGAMIDDVIFKPAESTNMDIDWYSVYRAYEGGEPELVLDDINTTSAVHVTGNDHKATYYVVTNHMDGDETFTSPLSNPARIDGSGVDELEAGRYVGGGKGKVLVGGAAGETLTLHDAEGKLIAKVLLTSDRETIACGAGIYVATLGEKSVKVIVR